MVAYSMKFTLQTQINQISNALGQLGMRKAYNVVWPKHNYRGFNFRRIAECVVALGIMDPEDVPCWDYWLETYRVTELFWRLWEYDQNERGEPQQELEDLLDARLNDCFTTQVIPAKETA